MWTRALKRVTQRFDIQRDTSRSIDSIQVSLETCMISSGIFLTAQVYNMVHVCMCVENIFLQ